MRVRFLLKLFTIFLIGIFFSSLFVSNTYPAIAQETDNISRCIYGVSSPMVIDKNNGNLHIVFRDITTPGLQYGYYDGEQWTTEIIDPSNDVKDEFSIQLDESGTPNVTYVYGQYETEKLMYAQRIDNAWNLSEIVSAQYIFSTSLGISSNGERWISWIGRYPNLNDALWFSHYDGSSWNTSLIDVGSNYHSYINSLDINQLTDYPSVAYYDQSNSTIKYAGWNGNSWDIETVRVFDKGGVNSVSLCFDTQGCDHLLFSYGYIDPSADPSFLGEIIYGVHEDDTWSFETIDTNGDIGSGYLDLYLDSNDHPHVAYNRCIPPPPHEFDYPRSLIYANKTGQGWFYTTITTTRIHDLMRISLVENNNSVLYIMYLNYDGSEGWGTYFASLDTQTQIQADFVGDVLQGVMPLTVNFSIQSIGDTNSWLWDFGDGITSIEQNPSHTYVMPGAYKVRLTISGFSGTYIVTKSDYVKVYSGSWQLTGNLNIPRSFHSATLLNNGKVLVTGGRGLNLEVLSSCELYDPNTGLWSLTGSMNIPREHRLSTILLPNGNVLACGGSRVGNLSAEIYDTETNTWSFTEPLHNTSPLNVDLNDIMCIAPLNDGKVIAVKVDSAEIYDPVTNSWFFAGITQYSHVSCKAILLPNGKVLVTGGDPGKVELYDPDTNSWTGIDDDLIGWSVGLTTNLLDNGLVLITGGVCGLDNIPKQSSELYNYETSSWITTGSMDIGRYFHTATLLPDGQVLVAGGTYCFANDSHADTSSTEVYDPYIGQWSISENMNFGRTWHTATLLQNGKVLVAGGYNYTNENNLTCSELYTPANLSTPSAEIAINSNPVEGGTVNISPDGPYLIDQTVTITATAATGYYFDNWSGDASGIDNPLTITLDTNKNITANFMLLNTQAGEDVVVTDPESGVNLTFDNVTFPGQTSVTVTNTAIEIPNGFSLGNPPTYYDIKTTAEFDGLIDISLDYSGITYVNEDQLRLYHYDVSSNSWEDITTLVDTENDVIYGQTTSLSPFVILQPGIVLGSINAPQYPVSIGSMINANAAFTYAPITDTHTALWDWGDGSSSSGILSEGNNSGLVTGEHSYAQPGVYTITLTVTNQNNVSGSSVFEYVVVFDPNGAYVTGGGWIESPVGAYTTDPSLTGKATFGFVSKYQKGTTIPTGNTEFQFHAAGMNFKSTSYEWLVVAGSKAQFKGTGTINGEGTYKFMVFAKDGSPDTFRIKITDTSDNVIYDNVVETALGGGSILVHTK